MLPACAYPQEEEERRKARRRKKGRIRELEEIRAELAEKVLPQGGQRGAREAKDAWLAVLFCLAPEPDLALKGGFGTSQSQTRAWGEPDSGSRTGHGAQLGARRGKVTGPCFVLWQGSERPGESLDWHGTLPGAIGCLYQGQTAARDMVYTSAAVGGPPRWRRRPGSHKTGEIQCLGVSICVAGAHMRGISAAEKPAQRR